MSVELNATLVRRAEINHGLLVLRVKPDFDLAAFTPGQYVVLGLPGSAPRLSTAGEGLEDPPDPNKLIRRAYSIASSSLQGEYLEFFVALVRSGQLTPRLFALQEGDRLYLGEKITGMFTLNDVGPDRDVLFVATGTGLAPYVSMLRSSYDFASRKTVVIHAARVSWDLGYRGELEALAAQWPTMHYLPIIDMPQRDPGWKGPVGFVYHYFDDGTVRELLGYEPAPGRTAVFLCGNPNMVTGMIERLTATGMTRHKRRDPGDIFVEEYW